jgi:excisionase family DNA binding protein
MLLEFAAPQTLWTADDVAARLGVKKKLIYRLVSEDRIPYLRVGDRLVRFRPDAIDRWIEESEKGW